MSSTNLQLLASGEFSDFTIICQGVEFKVHKNIICPESSFFRAACTGPFKERHEATLSLPEEDPEILARVLLSLYTREVDRHSITKEIEKTLAKLVPGGPTTERSKFETCVLVYFCAYRQGIGKMKLKLAEDVGSLIREFEEGDMNDDFAAFVEKMYNDIPAKDDPLRAVVTAEALKHLGWLDLLPLWGGDDSDDDSGENYPKRTHAFIQAKRTQALIPAKRIRALIRANERSALRIAVDLWRRG